jgi:serine/threonine-protein kinase
LEEVERILDANGDQTSTMRIAADGSLSAYWRTVGRDLGKARSYAMKAVEIGRRYHPNTEHFAGALHQAALAEGFAHNTSASLELYKESVELHRRLGVPEIDLIRPLTEMAEQEAGLARFAEAERDFKETVAMSLRVNGEDHVDTIQTRIRYGSFLRTLGRLRESELLLRKAVETGVRLLGPDESFHLPTARFELARTLAELGKIEDAELLYQQALTVREKTRPNTYQHANMLESGALLQEAMGRYELADRMLSQAASIQEKIGRHDSPTRLFRARYQLAVGEAGQALSTLAATTFSGSGALQNSFVADVVRTRALLDLGRPEDAERVASESLDRLRTTQGAEAFQYSKANLLVSHGLALTRLGRAKEALTPLQDAMAWREANLDENSPIVAESLIALAECYLSQGERAQVRSLVERAQRIYQSHPNLGERVRLPLRKVEELFSAR